MSLSKKVNSWLAKVLQITDPPPPIDLIVHVEPDRLAEVTQALQSKGYMVQAEAFSFILVQSVPPDQVAVISEIPGVIRVSYNAPVRINSLLPPALFPSSLFPGLPIQDPLVGEFGLDDVVAPKGLLGPDLFLPLSPFKVAAIMTGNYKFVPSADTKKLLLDVQTDLDGSGVKVAVIDTGIGNPTHPQNLFHVIPYNASFEPDPADRCGHGSWCNYRVGGYSFASPYGECNGIAPACTLYSIKALNSLGMGSTYEILRAMQMAVNLGVKIVSMSLGSTPQGSYTEDPTAQGVEQMYQNGIITVAAAGNCLAKGSFVYTTEGPIAIEDCEDKTVYSLEAPSIKEIEGKHFTLTLNRGGNQWTTEQQRFRRVVHEKIIAAKVKRVVKQGIRPIFFIKTLTRSIKATANHPFLCYDGHVLEWKELCSIKEGDLIVIEKRLPVCSSALELDARLVRLVGGWIGDGYTRIRGRNRRSISWCIPEGSLRDEYKKMLERLFPSTHIGEDKSQIHIYTGKVADRFIALGCHPSTARTKRVPSWVFDLPNHLLVQFLQGYLETDGHQRYEDSSSGGNKTLSYNFEASNRPLLEDIRFICLRLGYRSGNITKRVRAIKIFNGCRLYHYKALSWNLRVYPQASHDSQGNKSLHPNEFKQTEYLGLETVREIKPLGQEETYDIEIEATHNFITEGIPVHNSGPDGATIDSPGISPHAITVGAWSVTDDAVPYFSSRGPTPDGLVKPDVCSYGGGRSDPNASPTELIVNGTEGWLDPMYDALLDGWTQLQGTSMGTPHIAGLLALVEQDRNKQGKTLTIEEIQSILAEKGNQTKTNDAGFGLCRLSWFTG